MTRSYSPRPLRETSPHKSAADIQRELDLMRAIYAERRNLNTPRNAKLVGWSLVAVMLGVPVVAAIIIKLL